MDAEQSKALGPLAERAARGEEAAFTELVERTHRRLYQLALRLVSDRSDAEDVVQETYIRSWQALGTLRDPSTVMGWLFRVTRNVAHDRMRQRKRRRVDSLDQITDAQLTPLVERLASADPDPEQTLSDATLARAAEALLAQLPDKHRVVLTLREVDELSYEEIAEALGCAVGTVESRLHRARKALTRKTRRLARELGAAHHGEEQSK